MSSFVEEQGFDRNSDVELNTLLSRMMPLFESVCTDPDCEKQRVKDKFLRSAGVFDYTRDLPSQSEETYNRLVVRAFINIDAYLDDLKKEKAEKSAGNTDTVPRDDEGDQSITPYCGLCRARSYARRKLSDLLVGLMCRMGFAQ